MAQQRHLERSPYVCTQPLRLPWTDLHQNRKTVVSWPDTQKSLKGHCEKLNRKSAILHLVAILAIFNSFYFDVLVPGLSSDQLKI